MPKMVALGTIILHRKDKDSGLLKQVIPELNKVFDFTADEIASAGDLVREPVSEDKADAAGKASVAPATNPNGAQLTNDGKPAQQNAPGATTKKPGSDDF